MYPNIHFISDFIINLSETKCHDRVPKVHFFFFIEYLFISIILLLFLIINLLTYYLLLEVTRSVMIMHDTSYHSLIIKYKYNMYYIIGI
jgi:hypothetical protein